MLLVLTTGCANLFNGGNSGTLVNINSIPPAKVTITDKKGKQTFMDTTPTSTYLKASDAPRTSCNEGCFSF